MYCNPTFEPVFSGQAFPPLMLGTWKIKKKTAKGGDGTF